MRRFQNNYRLFFSKKWKNGQKLVDRENMKKIDVFAPEYVEIEDNVDIFGSIKSSPKTGENLTGQKSRHYIRFRHTRGWKEQILSHFFDPRNFVYRSKKVCTICANVLTVHESTFS